jgi:hypothetical protein
VNSPCLGMRMIDMTPKQLSSVPCPQCGAATGKRCLQPSGALRAGPHVDRRLSAIEAVEVKRDRVVGTAGPSLTKGTDVKRRLHLPFSLHF